MISCQKMLVRGVAVIVAALGACDLAFGQQAEPIKIGVILPLTGAGAGIGIPEWNGARLAEKLINAKGGFKGRPFKLIIEDDTTNPDIAISKANKLIYNEKVVAIIGPAQTANTVAVSGLTHSIQMPQLAMSGLGPAIERDRTCTFHINGGQDLNARAMMEYVQHIGVTRVGVLYDTGYGTVVFNELKKLVSTYGVEFVATEKFEISATDATPQAAKLKAANPDALMVIGITGIPVRSIRQLQMTQPIVAAVGQASYETAKSMGDAADNVIFPEYLVGEDPLPNQVDFVKAYEKEFGRLPKIFEAAGWDAVHILLAAFEKVGPDAGNAALCEAIRAKHKGEMAEYDFSSKNLNGIKLSDVVYSKLIAGQFTRLPFRAKD